MSKSTLRYVISYVITLTDVYLSKRISQTNEYVHYYLKPVLQHRKYREFENMCNGKKFLISTYSDCKSKKVVSKI